VSSLFLVPDPVAPAGYSWLPYIVPLILLLGGGGGYVAWKRLRTEGPKILIEAAQGAVIVQSGVIEDLRDQILDLRAQLQESLRLQRRVRQLEQSEEHLKAENISLKAQVSDLQKRITDLEAQS